MKLSDRVGKTAGAAAAPALVSDRFGGLKNQIHLAIIEELGPQLFSDEIGRDELELKVAAEINARLATQEGLAREEREHLSSEIKHEILGYGPLERLLADDAISEIMVNGPFEIWIESHGRLTRTPYRFNDEGHLRRIIQKMVAQAGRRIDESSPMVDARLPDGSRLNAVIPPLAVDSSLVTVRKFSKEKFTLDDLARKGSLTPDSVTFLDMCVKAKLNILISGGTGSGKTTLLNALSGAIPDDDRIITIEDAAELQLNQAHVLRMEARQKNIEGEGEVSIRDLVRNALRMRPDRIVVGECRGSEALDMLQAMNTGHDGSLSTVHANTTRDAISRLETMVLMAGFELPMNAIRKQICSAVDLIIHVERFQDGTRRVSAITEVQRMESEIITTQDLFLLELDSSSGGRLQPTGLRPQFGDKFTKSGLAMPASLFSGRLD